ncbi:MAG: hypothetical protein SPJ17_06910 [Anaeroplasma sp.]|uniref:hypothetical protein n=1 Tax=Anaeroplasma sp. TaxID=1872523 RepID=UPI002A91E65F|nr:hypothetical protein [Anaeroplasma sp.]MDY5983411.1 hypothetical protein [Anaeroplasma sp.]
MEFLEIVNQFPNLNLEAPIPRELIFKMNKLDKKWGLNQEQVIDYIEDPESGIELAIPRMGITPNLEELLTREEEETKSQTYIDIEKL